MTVLLRQGLQPAPKSAWVRCKARYPLPTLLDMGSCPKKNKIKLTQMSN